MQHNSINKIPQKEADTKNERLLLGKLDMEAKRIGFGTIRVEVVIRDCQLYQMVVSQPDERVNIGGN